MKNDVLLKCVTVDLLNRYLRSPISKRLFISEFYDELEEEREIYLHANNGVDEKQHSDEQNDIGQCLKHSNMIG